LALLAACSERQRLYEGLARPADQVALLTNAWGFWSERVVIVRVDDTKIPRQAYSYEVELNPGLHIVEFGYDGAYGHSVTNAVLSLNAEAGHHYEARAHDRGPDRVWGAVIGGPGTWEGSIFDITAQRTVVPQATPEPSASRTPSQRS